MQFPAKCCCKDLFGVSCRNVNSKRPFGAHTFAVDGYSKERITHSNLSDEMQRPSVKSRRIRDVSILLPGVEIGVHFKTGHRSDVRVSEVSPIKNLRPVVYMMSWILSLLTLLENISPSVFGVRLDIPCQRIALDRARPFG
jgi:hypothetical protein